MLLRNWPYIEKINWQNEKRKIILYLVILMKIKELILLNIKIIKDGSVVFEGTTEEVPNNIKELEYRNITFEGVNVVVEI